MPSKSPAQAKLMRAVAHNPEFARKVGIPQSVGEEFNAADEAQGTLSKLMSQPKRRKKRIIGPLSNGPM